jgi:N-acetylneuraminate synthase
MVEIIAEAGVNHDGDIEAAFALVDASRAAGADTVKFQTFKTERLVTGTAVRAAYQKRALQDDGTQADMLRRLELSEPDFRRLAEHARSVGIEFLSTPFDQDSARFLVDGLGLARLKVGSGDLDNLPLLITIARTGARVVLSTGMGGYADVENALAALAFGYSASPDAKPSLAAIMDAYCSQKNVLDDKVVVLHCTTEYPAPVNSLNLRAIEAIRCAFKLPVGFSDHSVGHEAAVAAVALGATVIEKHITLDRSRKGPDHAASLDPAGFAELVRAIRSTEVALGDGIKRVMAQERANIRIARKSIVASRSIRTGETFNDQNITLKRSESGLPAVRLYDILGTRADRDYDVDEAILVT